MAMTVRYLTIDGEIVSETRSGVRSDYIPDPLGSTAALINSSHTITDTFLWWPYGEQRSHVGSSKTPFGFEGGIGYYRNPSSRAAYARRRIIDFVSTQWLSVDPIWPEEFPYAYVADNPLTRVDPNGYSGFAYTCYFSFVQLCMDIVDREMATSLKNCNQSYKDEVSACKNKGVLDELGLTYGECVEQANSNLGRCKSGRERDRSALLAACLQNPQKIISGSSKPVHQRHRGLPPHP